MVVIPTGSFKMGDNLFVNASFVHQVDITTFAIGKYEVTFDEYDEFAEATGSGKPDDKGWGNEISENRD